MNNKYYKVIEMIREMLDSIPTLNTKVFSRSAEKDLFKNSLYPLAHISNEGIDFQTINVNTFTFELGVLDKRVIDNKLPKDKFYGDTNIINNFATTYAIVNDFLTQLHSQNYEGLDYDVEFIGNITPIYLNDTGGLDGWAVIFSISVANDLDIC